MKYAINSKITSEDIRNFRKKLGLTQREFADLFGVSKPTVERWEASDKEVSGPIAVAIAMMTNNMNYVKSLMIPEKKTYLRVIYMYKNEICTIIDVDETNQQVSIKNYRSNNMFKAFGANEEPSYSDYLEFMESRCFPRTRDKMKIMLKKLNIPFYDPVLIIEKTEGRMAEDDFWLKLERG